MTGALDSTRTMKRALFAALVFGACMPTEVEVGRDSTLDEPAGLGGVSGASGEGQGSPSGGADSPGGEFSAAGSDASGGSSVGQGGTGGSALVAGGPSGTMLGGRGGASVDVAGVGAGPSGTAGTGLLGGGGIGGTPGLGDFVCPSEYSNEDALWSLDVFCRTFVCPQSVDGAKLKVLGELNDCGGVRTEMRTGCGNVQIGFSSGLAGEVYLFAGDPPELVGAGINSETPWGPCSVSRYFGGVVPRACDEAETCSFCGSNATCPME